MNRETFFYHMQLLYRVRNAEFAFATDSEMSLVCEIFDNYISLISGNDSVREQIRKFIMGNKDFDFVAVSGLYDFLSGETQKLN